MAAAVSNQNRYNRQNASFRADLVTDANGQRVFRNRTSQNVASSSNRVGGNSRIICKFYASGNCRFGERCRFAHVDNPVPNTVDSKPKLPQTAQTPKSVLPTEEHSKPRSRKEHDTAALARSKDKTCGVCFEIVLEKGGDRRFGILPNCNHCFCLSCIGKWRQAKQYDVEIKRACPECRVVSNFVCPSRYWADEKKDKDKLIAEYMECSSKKACRHFRQGKGKCPFGNKCFFLHALPDGTKIDVGLPPKRPSRHRYEFPFNLFQQAMLWEPLEDIYSLVDELDDIMDFLSDSDDDDDGDDDDEDYFLSDMSDSDYIW